MSRDDLNLCAITVAGVIPDEGVGETFVTLAIEEGSKGRIRGTSAVNALIQLGVLARQAGHVIKPGPRYQRLVEVCKAAGL